MKQILVKLIGGFINLVSLFSPRFAGKMAIKLFSSPRRIKLKEPEKDFLMTAFIEDVEYEHINIMTYRWLGKKDTVLLAHGWESNSFRWKPLIEKLKASDYNVIALDAPAHGRSSGKDFNAILYSECIHVVAKKFKANIIIGHSVGGMATAFFHQKYKLPSVNRLVFLGAPSNFVGVYGRYVQMMSYNKRIATVLNDMVYERFNEKPDYFNAARLSENIEAEGLIIHDELDKVIPFSDAKDYESFYKRSKLVTTKGHGHSLQSEEVHNHILDFINA
jgi:pimeloyl-ACP methyl ester carboxylesterase